MIGGGIGVPPMLQTAKEIEGEAIIVSGYRNQDLFLKEELESAGTLFIATEDGSVGTKGNVVDAIRENQIEADMMFACGPKPMLRALKDYALEKRNPLLDFHGREDGMWNWSLSCLCMSV